MPGCASASPPVPLASPSMSDRADIAVVGLAVMGANLALNLADAGNKVVVYNRTHAVTDEFMRGEAATKDMIGPGLLEEMVALLETPRVILLMVKAGPAGRRVDRRPLTEHLEPGDIIIDGGNSLYTDTERRQAEVEDRWACSTWGSGSPAVKRGPDMGPR